MKKILILGASGYIGSRLSYLLSNHGYKVDVVTNSNNIKNKVWSKKFNRIFSYCFASFLGFHFIINIGMTIGLIPTIGIPLPYISYGGSNLLTFSMFLMIYLNLDANRLN